MRHALQIPAAFLLLMAATAASAIQTGDPLELPAPMALPAIADRAAIARALTVALERRGWDVVSDNGDSLLVRLPARPEDLRLRLQYGGTAVRFFFVDDTRDMHPSHEQHFLIHPAANAVFRAVGDEVRMQLRLLASEHARARVVPLAPEFRTRPALKVERLPGLRSR